MIFIVDGEEILLAIEENRLTIGILKDITIPRDCPRCSQRGLSRHGSYWREIEFSGRLYKIPIQRVRCLRCGSSGSCLYDFMIPYSRRGAEEIGAMIHIHPSHPEAMPASSRARWRVSLVSKLPSAILNLHRAVVDAGVSLRSLNLPMLCTCKHPRSAATNHSKKHLLCYFRELVFISNFSYLDVIIQVLRAPYSVTTLQLDDQLPSTQNAGKVPSIGVPEPIRKRRKQPIAKPGVKEHKKVEKAGKARGSNVLSLLPRTNSNFSAAIYLCKSPAI